jgi:hypothetical protein
MKRLLAFTIAIVSISSAALGQPPGVISLYTDMDRTGCEIVPSGGLVMVYVFHEQTTGATGSQFKVEQLGSNFTFLGDQSPYAVVLGSSQTGIAFGYQDCVPGPNHILTIYYLGGTYDVCSQLAVVPHPDAVPSEILVADCTTPNPVIQAGGGCGLAIAPDLTCPCNQGDCIGRWTEDGFN